MARPGKIEVLIEHLTEGASAQARHDAVAVEEPLEIRLGDEPVADIVAESSRLEGIEISGDAIPRSLDELPVLAAAASLASGTTTIRDAAELRIKESDRIAATVAGLSSLGADIEERPDGMIIRGVDSLKGAPSDSAGDHRIAMTMAVAGLAATGETTIAGAEAADVSYPGFWQTLDSLTP